MRKTSGRIGYPIRVSLALTALWSPLVSRAQSPNVPRRAAVPSPRATWSEASAQQALAALAALSDERAMAGMRALANAPTASMAMAFDALRGLQGLDALVAGASRAASGALAAASPGEVASDQSADSAYRLARDAMKRGDYKGAASMFGQVVQRFPKSDVAGDALYWQAFSLYRSGGSSDLSSALASLDRLSRDYRSASGGDASTLRIRICGEMARRGDERCASQVAIRAHGPADSVGGRPRAGPAAGGARGSTRDATQDTQGCPKEDDDDDERIAALNALLQMDAERALPILERVLARRDKCSTALRRKAVFLVSQKGDSKAADILMNVIRSDPDQEVREQAVFWLGQTHDERAVDMLQEILQKETNPELLDKAVFALSQHRSGRAATILRDLAQRDGAPLKMREQAIFWLGQQRSSDNAELLKSLYKRVKEEELKEKIIFSVSQNRSAGNDKWLLDVALDEKEEIEMRKKALFWAGQNRSASMDDLGALYTRITNRDLKEQLIFVYSQRRESAAIDKLLDIAKNEKDRELRKKAIFWLSQSRDPRVAKFLEDLIG